MIARAGKWASICPEDPEIYMQEREPNEAEHAAIDTFVAAYEKAVGRIPHGLIFLPLPGHKDTVPVWFPIP